MDNISIRALTSDDWEILLAMRIKAVTLHTDYFGSTPDQVKQRSTEEWREFLSHPKRCIFGLFDGETLIGITGISPLKEDPEGPAGELHYSFIEPEYRGKGLSNLFYKSRIDWAVKNTDWTKITAAHREGNEPSRRAMVKHDFVFTHKKMDDWPDGTKDLLWEYELDLEKLRP